MIIFQTIQRIFALIGITASQCNQKHSLNVKNMASLFVHLLAIISGICYVSCVADSFNAFTHSIISISTNCVETFSKCWFTFLNESVCLRTLIIQKMFLIKVSKFYVCFFITNTISINLKFINLLFIWNSSIIFTIDKLNEMLQFVLTNSLSYFRNSSCELENHI